MSDVNKSKNDQAYQNLRLGFHGSSPNAITNSEVLLCSALCCMLHTRVRPYHGINKIVKRFFFRIWRYISLQKKNNFKAFLIAESHISQLVYTFESVPK